LKAIVDAEPQTSPLLLVFGRKSFLEEVNVTKHLFSEWGEPVYADLIKTKYGCRIYRFVGTKA